MASWSLRASQAPVGADAHTLPIGRDLAEQLRQHGRVTPIAAGSPDRADLQRSLVDPGMDLAPGAGFCPALLARVPLAFPFDLAQLRVVYVGLFSLVIRPSYHAGFTR